MGYLLYNALGKTNLWCQKAGQLLTESRGRGRGFPGKGHRRTFSGNINVLCLDSG